MWERTPSGRFKLTYLKVRESIQYISDTEKEVYYRVWREDRIETWKVVADEERMIGNDG